GPLDERSGFRRKHEAPHTRHRPSRPSNGNPECQRGGTARDATSWARAENARLACPKPYGASISARRSRKVGERNKRMFDKYMVLTRGFQNVRENGRIVGFRMLVRITYYRGVYLPIVGGFQVKVDGEEFPASRMTFTVGGRAFTMEE